MLSTPQQKKFIMPAAEFTAKAPVVASRVSCSGCHLRELCLPGGVSRSDVQRLDDLKFGQRRVKVGQTLYRAGEHFQFMYAVRSGTFRSTLMLADGREQVNGFYMAGEVMGQDGVAHGTHASRATALEDAQVCVIPYASLIDMVRNHAGLRQLLVRLMSREIGRNHGHVMLLGNMNAEEKLATFLLNLSAHMEMRGYSASEFHLRMSRAEIGSYLGMTLETVSRTFSAFQQARLLKVDKRHIRLIDLDGLRRAFQIHPH
jgi:CRP/FNR family transcriptional regulator